MHDLRDVQGPRSALVLVGRRRSFESALQGKEVKSHGHQAAQRVLEDSCEVKMSEGFAWTIALGLTSAAPKVLCDSASFQVPNVLPHRLRRGLSVPDFPPPLRLTLRNLFTSRLPSV